MTGKYERYYWNILSAKEEKENKIKEQKKKERDNKIAERLRRSLFKGGAKTKTKGKNLRVSAEAGIKGLLRI